MKQNPLRFLFVRRSVPGSWGDVHVAWFAADGEFRTGAGFETYRLTRQDWDEGEEGERKRERGRSARGGKAKSATAKTAGYDTTSATVATRLNFQPGRRSSLETAAPLASARKLLRRLADRQAAPSVSSTSADRSVEGARRRKITFHPIGTAWSACCSPTVVDRVCRIERGRLHSGVLSSSQLELCSCSFPMNFFEFLFEGSLWLSL